MADGTCNRDGNCPECASGARLKEDDIPASAAPANDDPTNFKT